MADGCRGSARLVVERVVAEQAARERQGRDQAGKADGDVPDGVAESAGTAHDTPS